MHSRFVNSLGLASRHWTLDILSVSVPRIRSASFILPFGLGHAIILARPAPAFPSTSIVRPIQILSTQLFS